MSRFESLDDQQRLQLLEYLSDTERDLRNVLDTLHESSWIHQDEFRSAFIENGLGDFYDDLYGESDRINEAGA